MPPIDPRTLLRDARDLARLEPDPAAADRAIEVTRAALLQAERADRKAHTRRLIMRLWIPSGVAAAVLLAIGIVSLMHGSPSASAAEQFEKVVAASRDYKGWMHVERTAHHPTTRVWGARTETHLNTIDGTRIWIRDDGDQRYIEFDSLAQKEARIYSSRTQEIRIGGLIDGSPNSYQSMLPYVDLPGVLEMLKKEIGHAPQDVTRSREGGLDRYDLKLFKDDDEARSYRAKPNGIRLGSPLTVWVDPGTNRTAKMQITQGPLLVLVQISYGPPEIHDLYDLGVPRTAKIIDNRPSPEVKAVFDRLDARVAKGFGDHVAIVTTSASVDGAGQTRGAPGVYLYALKGPKWLAMEFQIAQSLGNIVTGRPVSLTTLPANWPLPNPQTLLEQLRQAPIGQYWIMDGDHGWTGGYSDRTESYNTVPIEPSERIWLSAAQSVAGKYVWPNRQQIWTAFHRIELQKDADHPNLLGLRVERQFETGGVEHEDTWLDPARDDMPVEAIHRVTSKNRDHSTRTEYLAYAQLLNGQWYPTRWRTTNTDTIANRPPSTSTTESNLQLIPGMTLDDAWFTPPTTKPAKNPQ